MAEVPAWQQTVDRAGAITTIILSGELDLSASSQIRQAIAEALGQPGLSRLGVDMSNVTFIDSTIMAALIYAHNSTHAIGCRLTVSTSPQVRRRLQLAGLEALFDTTSG